MVAQRVVVLDNGGCTCKIGFAGEEEPLKCACPRADGLIGSLALIASCLDHEHTAHYILQGPVSFCSVSLISRLP